MYSLWKKDTSNNNTSTRNKWIKRLVLYVILATLIWNVTNYALVDYQVDERIGTPVIYTQTITRTTVYILPTESPPPLDNVDIPPNDPNTNNDNTDVPEIESDYDSSGPELSKDELVNLKYCKSTQCKFVLAYKHSEQESKAQMHFRSIVGLALLLNRTIVLPNVSGSRIGACRSHPFNYYYDIDGLREQFPQLNFIYLADFKKWTTERETAPTMKFVEIIRERIIKKNWVSNGFTDGEKLRKISCLGDCHPLMIPGNVSTTRIGLYNGWARTPELAERGHSLILNNTQTVSEEFLLINAHSFGLLFPTEASKKPLKYSSRIEGQAKSLATHLQPYLAIHWRMETAAAENMPECAEKLVAFVENFKKKHSIENVYLSTDYPLTGKRSQSSTFHKVTSYHHRAIQYVNKTLHPHTWITLGALGGAHEHENELSGAGVSGILDKIVCTYSNWFIRAPLACRKKGSSWTSMVLHKRIGLRESGAQGIKNTMDEWAWK
ncbi:11007_t:CDS:2 [Paraglomus brasilianum]|uniref:GDP-fucose protein O-fucosyltransferase 2 n=1 Tax=Paraglomus brasilianum TaxID=144538 RepID=A0A9N9D6I2_9GLOM|nr:11007_t:CDS:2 [Paraglomus brasilianum]